MESLDLEQGVRSPIFVLGLRVSQHETFSTFFVDPVQLIKEVTEAGTFTMRMTFNVCIVAFLKHFLHGFEPLSEGFLKTRAVKYQIPNFLPLLIDGRPFLNCGEGLGEATSSDEELAVKLTVGPVTGKKFGRKEAVAIAGEHH
jgi:hypothetical protein